LYSKEEEEEIEDGWIFTHHAEEGAEDISDGSEEQEEDIPDLEDFDQDNLVDPGVAGSDNILKTRTYDLTITYDKYYQTPRMWLFGYDEKGRALKPSQVFEDVSQDHAKKTVTIENHPHMSITVASVHPCKHANVMKKIIDQMMSGGKEPRVDHYLILFLKFMSSVLPTIDYDYTMSMEA
jgi:ubiquitin-like-conjugating enzyme ATG3